MIGRHIKYKQIEIKKSTLWNQRAPDRVSSNDEPVSVIESYIHLRHSSLDIL